MTSLAMFFLILAAGGALSAYNSRRAALKYFRRLCEYDDIRVRISKTRRPGFTTDYIVDMTLAELAMFYRSSGRDRIDLAHFVHGDAQTLSLSAELVS